MKLYEELAPVEWMEQAVCAGIGGDPFFPEVGSHGNEAKAICYTCPVINPCLDFALSFTSHGIWAGTTEKERNKIRKRQLKLSYFNS